LLGYDASWTEVRESTAEGRGRFKLDRQLFFWKTGVSNTIADTGSRRTTAVTLSPAAPASIDQIMGSSALVPHNGFHLEPRCRICRNDLVRKKVNDLLATGASYAMIVRALAADNAELDQCDRVTIDSVRNHCGRHFPVQNVAKATYREILERRAKANGVDFVEGVATALTPVAFLETVMVKSYETLVDSDTKVDVSTGMVAAGRLQSLIDSRDYGRELLVLKVQLGQISQAVRSVVPQSMWGEIIEKLDEAEQHSEALDIGEDAFDDADDDPYDPTEFIDEDDEF
jgi:hypothetical protein